jgi:hypothetical protein
MVQAVAAGAPASVTEAARAGVAEAPAPRASGGGCWTEEVRVGGRHRRLEGGAWEMAADGI